MNVIVVGAGIAGLVVARDLARAGVSVTVLEAADHAGGQLIGIEVGGVVVDAAAESYATRSGAVAELAAELGLETVRPLGAPAWIISTDGRQLPLPAASVLGIPAEPFAPDVVAAIGTAGAWRALLDKLIPMLRPDKYATLGDLVRRRMGARVLDRLVAPVVRGVHSTSPDVLPVESAAPGLRQELRRTGSLAAAVAALRVQSPAGSQVAGVVGGLHRIAEELEADARARGVEFRFGTRVAFATRDVVELDDGERLEGRVVVAAPSITSHAARQREIIVAIAAVDAPELDSAPRGTGALIAAGAPGIAARAFTHSSAKWTWVRDALRSGGGERNAHRHIVRLSYDEMPEDPEGRVLADLRAITGADIDRLEDLAVRSWLRTLVTESAADGPIVVGEAASGTGLATIVPEARTAAKALAAELNEEHDD